MMWNHLRERILKEGVNLEPNTAWHDSIDQKPKQRKGKKKKKKKKCSFAPPIKSLPIIANPGGAKKRNTGLLYPNGTGDSGTNRDLIRTGSAKESTTNWDMSFCFLKKKKKSQLLFTTNILTLVPGILLTTKLYLFLVFPFTLIWGILWSILFFFLRSLLRFSIPLFSFWKHSA